MKRQTNMKRYERRWSSLVLPRSGKVVFERKQGIDYLHILTIHSRYIDPYYPFFKDMPPKPGKSDNKEIKKLCTVLKALGW